MLHGTDERYLVIDPGFTRGFGSIPDSYQTEVRREDAPNDKQSVTTINYHINGNNARFNQNSEDNSLNVVIESSDGVFEDLKTELRAHVADPQRISELEGIINDMQASQHDSKGMSEKLGQLISKGADLMGIIGPFVPMLAGIAASGS
ncbi:hypothetical protein [Halomonas beimenensis]|uniref:hypothetical protein n=1 Tax=Halomonas beimenensis TaxID=475662 RepID=UPI0012901B03|nr:hypothetical protein [Halomonas beimenensis]